MKNKIFIFKWLISILVGLIAIIIAVRITISKILKILEYNLYASQKDGIASHNQLYPFKNQLFT